MADFVSACMGVFRRDPQFSQFPWGHILCLYPLIAILTMQALLQKQLLARVNIRISSLWIATPLLASFVVPILAPQLIYDDCQLLKYLMAGLVESYDAPISTALVVFFLLLGFLQWIVLRRKLSLSIAWVVMPLINAMLVLVTYWWIDYNLPEPDMLAVLIPLALFLSETIPALTMSWLVNRKSNLPVPG